jgi:hypothetical protein
MNIQDVPFGTMDWSTQPASEHPGTTGKALWRTFEMGNIRVRMVEYTPGYLADHWCKRGHVLLVLERWKKILVESGDELPGCQ